MYCDEHGTLDYCPKCSKPSDEEIEHVAEEMSQQDWNDLRFKEVYRKAFLDGAKYFTYCLLHNGKRSASVAASYYALHYLQSEKLND